MKKTLLMLMLLPAGTAFAYHFNVELDYMVDSDHSHQPSADIVNAFRQPFLCQGHTITVIVDDALPHCDVLRQDPATCGNLFNYDDNTFCSFGQIRQSYFDHAGDSGWYYAVIAHQYQIRNADGDCVTTGSSGISNGGIFFIVSLGGWSGQTGTPFDNASTLFHEFGHNLGLGHCGIQNCGGDDTAPDYVGPHVPNMPSNMSYHYQVAGVKTNMECQGLSLDISLYKEMDFSHGILCAVNENALNEFIGSSIKSLDWDCDGTLEGSVAQNINHSSAGWCGAGGNRTTVTDYNEWANLSPGALLLEAAETGDAAALQEADYRFIDPADTDAVKQAAIQFLDTNKRPELFDELVASASSGDPGWLSDARFVFLDPADVQAVKDYAAGELERRERMLETQPCITAEQWQEVQLRAGCPQPALAVESCLGGDNVFLGDLVCFGIPPICFDLGLCYFPHGSARIAHDNHPVGSRFYLKPKTYDETDPLVLSIPGIWTCERADGGGSAVIR